MELIFDKKALKDLDKLPKKTATKILIEINDLKEFPNSKNIKKLVNFKPQYRKRIGDYRVLFEVEKNIITIYRIVPRKCILKTF